MRFYHWHVPAPLRIRGATLCNLLAPRRGSSAAATGPSRRDRQAPGPVKYPQASASHPHPSTELSVILRDCQTPSQVRPNQQ